MHSAVQDRRGIREMESEGWVMYNSTLYDTTLENERMVLSRLAILSLHQCIYRDALRRRHAEAMVPSMSMRCSSSCCNASLYPKYDD
jgi:hypothetical protein